MDSQTRRTIVGIYITVGVILFVVFYILLSGKILLHHTKEIKVYFDDVTWLRPGDPVIIYGIEKGKVKSFHLEKDKVLVKILLDPDVVLYDDSKISIRLVNYLGSDRYIKIVPGKSGVVPDFYYGYNASFDIELVASKLDSLSNIFSNLKLPDLGNLGDRFTNILEKNIKELTGMIKEPKDQLGLIALKLSLLIDTLNSMVQKQGTVARLVESDELYEEIRQTNQALKSLIEDIKANPKKYLEIKVF
jgi:ABC-type transporter Mla subunit MlaD|uniref:MCE family protein n=1 Tax=candidate division WOR-3 bacterium TaxID=2052148 RepID=A0A7V3RHF7_UNCW3